MSTKDRLRAELAALFYMLVETEDNSVQRKIATWALILIWGANFTLLNAGIITPDPWMINLFVMLTVAVIAIVAKMHQIQVDELMNYRITDDQLDLGQNSDSKQSQETDGKGGE